MSPPLSGYDVTLLSWVDHIHKRNFQSRPKAATALVSRLRADNLFYSYILALESIFHLWSELQKGWNISFSYSIFAKCSSASPSGYYLCSRVTRRITHKSGITKKNTWGPSRNRVKSKESVDWERKTSFGGLARKCTMKCGRVGMKREARGRSRHLELARWRRIETPTSSQPKIVAHDYRKNSVGRLRCHRGV